MTEVDQTAPERKCAYCRELGATARELPATPDAPAGVEFLHDHCYTKVSTLREYQQLLYALNATHHYPFDAILRRVLETRFTGWLDVRITTETRRALVEARVRLRLRAPSERPVSGWQSLPISPELVGALQRGLAAGSGISPEHSDLVDDVLDVDVSQQRAQPEATS